MDDTGKCILPKEKFKKLATYTKCDLRVFKYGKRGNPN
jgi:hypothetical protein